MEYSIIFMEYQIIFMEYQIVFQTKGNTKHTN